MLKYASEREFRGKGNKKYLALFLTGRGGNVFNGRELGDLAGRGWVIFARYARCVYTGIGREALVLLGFEGLRWGG